MINRVRKFLTIKGYQRIIYPLIVSFIVLCFTSTSAQIRVEVQYGELFKEVQLLRVFPDSKTFPDCIPLSDPDIILSEYQKEKLKNDFDLKIFVLKHFKIPEKPTSSFQTDTTLNICDHINSLWPYLTKLPKQENSSLIPLPNKYIIPGGRFHEIYYWDSYFTMLGLAVSGKNELIQNMLDNFAYLIDTYGFIPNGNRSYFLSRSQPPFFAMMLEISSEIKGDTILRKYYPQLRKEYEFWMSGLENLSSSNPAFRRVVRLNDGSILNRYWDDSPAPRPESYKEDIKLAQESGRDPREIYRHIRSAAESGWDFSSRWLADGKSLKSIHTTDIIPVDLNSLLYKMELTLAKMASLNRDLALKESYFNKAKKRKQALLKYCWDEKSDFFVDYDFITKKSTGVLSLAGMYPMFFDIADKVQANLISKQLENKFLKHGGLMTTLNHTGQQWDAPNGWAPLHYISIKGLENYGFTELANTITTNWINLNSKIYREEGKMTEKYNVVDTGINAGGGEYPNQDGFGWTNGVLLKLMSE